MDRESVQNMIVCKYVYRESIQNMIGVEICVQGIHTKYDCV